MCAYEILSPAEIQELEGFLVTILAETEEVEALTAGCIAEKVINQSPEDALIYGEYYTLERVVDDDSPDGIKKIPYTTIIVFGIHDTVETLTESIQEVQREHAFDQNGKSIERYWTSFSYGM